MKIDPHRRTLYCWLQIRDNRGYSVHITRLPISLMRNRLISKEIRLLTFRFSNFVNIIIWDISFLYIIVALFWQDDLWTHLTWAGCCEFHVLIPVLTQEFISHKKPLKPRIWAAKWWKTTALMIIGKCLHSELNNNYIREHVCTTADAEVRGHRL